MKLLKNFTPDWEKSELLPSIIQDFYTKEVLMLGFLNQEALELTLKTGFVHYFSRSKNRIWKKGETSGNTQLLKEAYIDCDNDSFLFLVEQKGAACHTGSKSCFYSKLDSNNSNVVQGVEFGENLDSSNLNYNFLDTLYHELLSRKGADPKTSYTASLFNKGENALGKKIIEEAGEVVMALKDKDREQIVYELADLTYHSLAALAFCNIHPEQVQNELKRRMGVSGIAEKNARPKD